jgi:uncharacterized protein YdiU (UPF0061 family)
LQEILSTEYRQQFLSAWRTSMAEKLGLRQYLDEHDEPLVSDLFNLLAAVETDMTIFFRQLANLSFDDFTTAGNGPPEVLLPAYYAPEKLESDYLERLYQWLDRYHGRRILDGQAPEERRIRMNRVNPKYILRNCVVQVAIEKAECGDFSRIGELLALARHPYDEQPENERYYRTRPDWARHKAGCAMLS